MEHVQVVSNESVRPHLTVDQLADRWHCDPGTVRRNWRKWQLNGMKFGKALIFPMESVEKVERKRMMGTKA